MQHNETRHRPKTQWSEPELFVHGKIEDITQSKWLNKTFGAGDDLSMITTDIIVETS